MAKREARRQETLLPAADAMEHAWHMPEKRRKKEKEWRKKKLPETSSGFSSGCGRPCHPQRRVPPGQEVRVSGASDSVLPQSAGHSSCDADIGTHRANCAANPHGPGALLVWLLRARCCATTGAGPDSADNSGGSAVAFFVGPVLGWTRLLLYPLSCNMVGEAVLKTLDAPRLQFIDMGMWWLCGFVL